MECHDTIVAIKWFTRAEDKTIHFLRRDRKGWHEIHDGKELRVVANLLPLPTIGQKTNRASGLQVYYEPINLFLCRYREDCCCVFYKRQQSSFFQPRREDFVLFYTVDWNAVSLDF